MSDLSVSCRPGNTSKGTKHARNVPNELNLCEMKHMAHAILPKGSITRNYTNIYLGMHRRFTDLTSFAKTQYVFLDNHLHVILCAFIPHAHSAFGQCFDLYIVTNNIMYYDK